MRWKKLSKNDLLSYGSIVPDSNREKGGRHIVCLSGGVASAWVAGWVKENIPHGPLNPPGLINYPHKCFKCQDTGSYEENVYDMGSSYKVETKCQCQTEIIYYFNDTKWEHPDLYRFLDNLEECLDIKITRDSDGRNPEEIFYKEKMLGSNRAPLCSKILKAKQTQEFVLPGDTLYFGIDMTEPLRAARITPIYERLECECRFPLFEQRILRHKTFEYIEWLGIEIPQMYKDGFTHNNCSGGCVRAGERQWVSLLNKYPDVYADRERVEREFTIWNNKRRLEKDKEKIKNGIKIKKPYKPREYHFMKEISLKTLREKVEQGIDFDFGEEEWQGECVGICGRMY